MTCTDALLQIDALIDGDLDDRRDLDAHLAACESCAREIDSRRALSDRLRQDLTAALAGVRPASGEKEQAVRRLMASRSAGFTLFIRAAAVVVIGVSIGFIAMLGGPRRADAAYVARAAETVATAEALQQMLPVMQKAVRKNYDEAARTMPRNHGTGPAGKILSAYLAGIGEPLAEFEIQIVRPDDVRLLAEKNVAAALRQVVVMPEDKVIYLKDLGDTLPSAVDYVIQSRLNQGDAVIDIVQKNDERTLRVRQYANASIVVELNGKVVKGTDVNDLIQRERGFCREIGLSGRDGEIVVGNIRSTGAVTPVKKYWGTSAQWTEFEHDAERAFTSVYMAKKKSADEAKKTAQAVLARARAAAAKKVEVEPVRVEDVLVRLRALDRAEIELEVADAEKRIVDLRKRLAELEDLESRVNSIKACVEALRSLDK